MEITLNVRLAEVLAAVAVKSAYAEAKKPGAEGPEERMSTVDEDDELLKPMVKESWADVVNEATHMCAFVSDESAEGDNEEYRLTLRVSEHFNVALIPAMETLLKEYLVNSVLGKWYMPADKEASAACLATAAGQLGSLHEMWQWRNRMCERKPSVF